MYLTTLIEISKRLKTILNESEACEYFLKHFLKQVGRAEK